jgi:hypothetical protein
MASSISAGNATNGVIVSSDNTGALNLITGSGSGTTAVTIDSSQNVGIGTATPGAKLDVSNTSGVALGVTTSTSGTAISSNNLLNSGFIVQYASGLTSIGNNFNNPLALLTNNIERARIDTTGNLLVGATSYVGSGSAIAGITLFNPSGTSGRINLGKTVSGTAAAMQFNHNGTEVGAINYTNTATSYVTTSDYRLKENVQPMVGALDKVAQLKPCTYTWKSDGSDSQGFIAHELQSVVPDCVTGEKDAVNEDGSIKPQGIDTSFLVATLTAAIQELKAELDALKAKVGE